MNPISTVSATERRLLPFVALQGVVATLGSFAGVFVFVLGGTPATLRYAALMLTTTAACLVLAYALGVALHLRCASLVRAAFGVPAALLWAADGRPDVLAVSFGTFLGLGWGARHWLELTLLVDDDRDRYAAHATVLTVAASLATTLVVTLLLHLGGERLGPVYAMYTIACVAGVALAARRIPETPPIRLQAPWAVIRQPAFIVCLPLFFLESGLLGIGQVLGASGAVRALGKASHFGWVATAATVTGGIALYLLRRHRQAHNRERWMALACVGVTLAHALLGASAVWPALFVAHLVLFAAVSPFWQASEQVLNQRTMDIQGGLADRIVARESVLWLFRMLGLGGFWWGASDLSDAQLLVIGSGLMALAALLEFGLGRAWLKRRPAAAAQAARG